MEKPNGPDVSKEQKEKLLNEKMEAIRKKNEELRKRHEEIEADKKLADKYSASVQMDDVKPYVMKPHRPRPEKMYSSADQDSINEDNSSGSAMDTTLLSRQRLPQKGGPPPDPTYRFLADPDRDGLENIEDNKLMDDDFGRGRGKEKAEGRFDETRRGRGRGSSDYDYRGRGRGGSDHDFRGRGRGRGGNDYDFRGRGRGGGGYDDKGRGGNYEDRTRGRGGFDGRGRSRGWEDRGRGRENNWKGGDRDHAGRYSGVEAGVDNYYEGSERGNHTYRGRGQRRPQNIREQQKANEQRKEEEQWKAERVMYDEARLSRARSGGVWKREWDMEKTEQENQGVIESAEYDPRFPRSKGEGIKLKDMILEEDIKKLEDLCLEDERFGSNSHRRGGRRGNRRSRGGGRRGGHDTDHHPVSNRNHNNWRDVGGNNPENTELEYEHVTEEKISSTYFEDRKQKFMEGKSSNFMDTPETCDQPTRSIHESVNGHNELLVTDATSHEEFLRDCSFNSNEILLNETVLDSSPYTSDSHNLDDSKIVNDTYLGLEATINEDTAPHFNELTEVSHCENESNIDFSNESLGDAPCCKNEIETCPLVASQESELVSKCLMTSLEMSIGIEEAPKPVVVNLLTESDVALHVEKLELPFGDILKVAENALDTVCTKNNTAVGLCLPLTEIGLTSYDFPNELSEKIENISLPEKNTLSDEANIDSDFIISKDIFSMTGVSAEIIVNTDEFLNTGKELVMLNEVKDSHSDEYAKVTNLEPAVTTFEVPFISDEGGTVNEVCPMLEVDLRKTIVKIDTLSKENKTDYVSNDKDICLENQPHLELDLSTTIDLNNEQLREGVETKGTALNNSTISSGIKSPNKLIPTALKKSSSLVTKTSTQQLHSNPVSKLSCKSPIPPASKGSPLKSPKSTLSKPTSTSSLSNSPQKILPKTANMKVPTKATDLKVVSKATGSKVGMMKSADAKVTRKAVDVKVTAKAGDVKVTTKAADTKVLTRAVHTKASVGKISDGITFVAELPNVSKVNMTNLSFAKPATPEVLNTLDHKADVNIVSKTTTSDTDLSKIDSQPSSFAADVSIPAVNLNDLTASPLVISSNDLDISTLRNVEMINTLNHKIASDLDSAFAAKNITVENVHLSEITRSGDFVITNSSLDVHSSNDSGVTDFSNLINLESNILANNDAEILKLNENIVKEPKVESDVFLFEKTEIDNIKLTHAPVDSVLLQESKKYFEPSSASIKKEEILKSIDETIINLGNSDGTYVLEECSIDATEEREISKFKPAEENPLLLTNLAVTDVPISNATVSDLKDKVMDENEDVISDSTSFTI